MYRAFTVKSMLSPTNLKPKEPPVISCGPWDGVVSVIIGSGIGASSPAKTILQVLASSCTYHARSTRTCKILQDLTKCKIKETKTCRFLAGFLHVQDLILTILQGESKYGIFLQEIILQDNYGGRT